MSATCPKHDFEWVVCAILMRLSLTPNPTIGIADDNTIDWICCLESAVASSMGSAFDVVTKDDDDDSLLRITNVLFE